MLGRNQRKIAQGRESGYALILMMFFLTLLVLSMVAASPSISNSIQREKEMEMIWRGKQYARGIRLYNQKMKRLPGTLDDLTKPSTAGIRFMRQAYKDPMNQVDGSWRLIYLGPNGQLIGSVNSIGGTGLGAAATGGAQTGGSSSFPTTFGRWGSTGPSATAPSTTSSATMNTASADNPTQPQTLFGAMDASNTIGGSIVGVGSKVDRKSLIVYNHMQNYKDFEFISDRSTANVSSASAGIGTPIQNSSGASQTNAGTPSAPPPNPGDWVNQMLPGSGMQPQSSQLPASPQN